MSLTFTSSDPETSNFETMIDNLVNYRNITVVAAAGNFNTSVDNITPARHSRANGGTVITVGGTNNQDHPWMCNTANAPWETCEPLRTVGTDWGPGIDIFAPAQNISSAAIRDPSTGFFSDTQERQQGRSGTSFASAMVAGLAARYLQTTGLVNPTAAQVWSYILGVASGDTPSTPPTVLSDGTDANSGPLNGSPNRLVYAPYATYCNH
jgi:subtilisin family serine protease